MPKPEEVPIPDMDESEWDQFNTTGAQETAAGRRAHQPEEEEWHLAPGCRTSDEEAEGKLLRRSGSDHGQWSSPERVGLTV